MSGSVCETTASSPFGDGTSTSGSCQPSPNFFTGKERDSESGLDNFGARYDASILGRFMSPDRPFADQLINAPQSWNLYSYVGNNPLRYLDQDGESTQTAANGDVLAVYDDGDLGVYQHTDIDDRADWDGSKLDWDDEGSNYMGETAHWDEFRDHDDRTGAILGNVAPGARILFGQSFDAVLKSLAKKAGQMNLSDISAQETPGGQFDIKNDKTVATYGPKGERTIKQLFAPIFLLLSAHMPRSAPVTGAVVQTWHYDSQTNLVTAQIVNVSHKDITAYNISIKETYAGGRPVRSHELMTDTAGEPAFIQELQGTVGEENLRKALRSTGGVGDGLFHPGESRKEIIGVQPGLQNFEAVIDVVAYADSTAEATNNDALQRLISHRKVALTSRQAANDIIKAALADPNDSDPAATAAKQIQNRITVWQAQKHTTLDFEPGVAKGVVDELRAISSRPLTDKRNALTQYLTKSEKRLATFSPHAELTKIGGPQ